MKPIITLCFCLLLIPSLATASDQQARQHIIVTLPPLSGLIAMLLPEVKSQCLLSAGADPHHFQPSPRQVDLLNQGHLLIRASRDDQGWNIRSKHSTVVDLWAKDNHAWLQFSLVKQALRQLSVSLSKQFPQYQVNIAQHSLQAQQTVTNMQEKWHKALQGIKNKGVVMQHPAWHDMLEAQAIPVWAVLESQQHGHEHGPHHLEDALTTLKLHPSSVLWGSKRHSNRSLEWLNRHQTTAQPIIKFDALGSCNQSWQALMQANLDLLQSTL